MLAGLIVATGTKPSFGNPMVVRVEADGGVDVDVMDMAPLPWECAGICDRGPYTRGRLRIRDASACRGSA